MSKRGVLRIFANHFKPARCVVPCGKLHFGCLVEIEVVAEGAEIDFFCAKCGIKESTSTRKPKCDCGGLWKLDFNAPRYDSSRIDKSIWGMFRYKEFMALEGETWRQVTLGEE